MSEKQEPKPQPEEVEETFFFPNIDEGLPYSCTATSLARAEVANADYLKQQKAST